MRRGIIAFVVLAAYSIFVAGAADVPLQIGGDYGRNWLATSVTSGDTEPVSSDVGNDLWSWGGVPIGHKVVNGTLEPETNLTMVILGDWLMMPSIGEPMVIDLTSRRNINDWMSMLYSDDPWVLAQHYERPIAIIG